VADEATLMMEVINESKDTVYKNCSTFTSWL